MRSPQLDLYFYYQCPYCQYVLNVIEENKIKVNLKNTREDQESLDKLVQVTGRRTVPCLFIDDQPMHESADIINWLKENLDQLEKIS